jgi:hypothetical protein
VVSVNAVSYAKMAIENLERIAENDATKNESLDMVENWIKIHRREGSEG